MKVKVYDRPDNETMGCGVTMQNDQSAAFIALHLREDREIELHGTPRELRGFARFVLEALKKPRGDR